MPEAVQTPARSYAPGIGIYRITNAITKHAYIGSTRHIERRFREHQNLLNANRHPNGRLQRAWNKHGQNAFSFEVVEFVETADDLIRREQTWLDNCCPYYNICLVANSRAGVKASDETRAKISASKRAISDETRRKMREAHARRKEHQTK